MQFEVERLGDGPIITPHMDARMGDNINGPSLIRVPPWLPSPLGRYYLYFAHHDGRYIRLAYADDLGGPWRMHEPGVLPLERSLFAGHIASPDVHVDHDEQRIRMYYHGAERPSGQPGPQVTRAAVSSDGLDFSAGSDVLAKSYLRVVRTGARFLGMAMPGVLYRAADPLHDFETGPVLFPSRMRHCALRAAGDALWVFYTLVGDAPERIVFSYIDMRDDWSEWRASEPIDVLAPEHDFEGANCPLRPSVRGLSKVAVNEVRDPALFEEDGQLYLLYSVAGERGIAIARVTPHP